MKANLREWINIFEQRTSKAAHPDMQLVMNILFEQIKDRYKSIDFKG
jgi:thymidylate synthase ThyX